MTRFPTVWAALDIAATTDMREIRRAYARRLKVTHPEDDPEGFQDLRAAYERAMQLAAQAAAADAQEAGRDDSPAQAEAPAAPSAAPVAAAAPESVSSPPPAAPIDDELRVTTELFGELERLTRPDRDVDVAAETAALARLLASPTLSRLDLLQRVEYGVSSMFADRIPRTDHLLAQATRFFEWEQRAHESSLPNPVRQVLARIGDFEFTRMIEKRSDEHSRAYRNLMSPPPSWKRWFTAHIQRDPPELRMLQHLGMNHPVLFNQVPTETVEWWRRFAQRPRPSPAMMMVGVVVTLLTFMFAMAGNAGAVDRASKVSVATGVALASSLAAIAFKYFVFDWPRVLIYRKWDGPPPWPLALAWLPVSVLAVAGAQLLQPLETAAWVCAAVAGLAFVWAAQVSGPSAPVSSKDLLAARPARAVLTNSMFFVFAIVAGNSEAFGDGWFVAICFALLASVYGREILSNAFFQRLSVKSRLVAIGAFGVVVATFTASVLLFGRHADYLPWIVWGTLVLTILRRALPHTVLLDGNVYAMLGIVFSGGIAALITSGLLKLDEGYDDTRKALCGFALFFLYGAALTIVMELRRMKQLHDRGQLN